MLKLHPMISKRKEIESLNDLSIIIIKYILRCSLFWILLSIILIFTLYNPSYTNNSSLKISSSWSLFSKASLILLATVIFSFLIGVIMSLPSIIMKVYLTYKLTKRRERGQKPVILIFITKYIPMTSMIILNILFIVFNFSIEPELFRYEMSISQENLLYIIADKFHNLTTPKVYNNFFDYGKKINSDKKQKSNFLFFIPSEYLDNENFFIKTKLLLKYENSLLITNPSKSDIISSIYHLYSSTNYTLYSPFPIQTNTDPIKEELFEYYKARKNIYLGIDYINSSNFYSLFKDFSPMNKKNLTWFDVFLNKLAFSQPQFNYFFKSGLFGKINQTWNWENLVLKNDLLLKKFTTESSNKNNNYENYNYENYNYFLTGIENPKYKNNILSEYVNTEQMLSKEKANKEDLELAQLIGGLILEGFNNIYLVPYKVNGGQNEITIHHFYSSMPLPKKTYVYNNLLNSIRQLYFNQENKTTCYLKTSENNNKYYESKFIDNINQKNPILAFENKYMLYVKSKITESYFCYTKDGSSYLIKRINDQFNPNSFNYGESFSSLFEGYFEKGFVSKSDFKKSKSPITKAQELFKIEFFNQFKILKVEENKNQLVFLKNNSDKYDFIKNYGDDIINEMFKNTNKN
jgi:hypothetical protein